MIYSNSLNSNEKISNKLKEQLYKIYNDKKIMKYFKEIDKLEKKNIESKPVDNPVWPGRRACGGFAGPDLVHSLCRDCPRQPHHLV